MIDAGTRPTSAQRGVDDFKRLARRQHHSRRTKPSSSSTRCIEPDLGIPNRHRSLGPPGRLRRFQQPNGINQINRGRIGCRSHRVARCLVGADRSATLCARSRARGLSESLKVGASEPGACSVRPSYCRDWPTGTLASRMAEINRLRGLLHRYHGLCGSRSVLRTVPSRNRVDGNVVRSKVAAWWATAPFPSMRFSATGQRGE